MNGPARQLIDGLRDRTLCVQPDGSLDIRAPLASQELGHQLVRDDLVSLFTYVNCVVFSVEQAEYRIFWTFSCRSGVND